MWKEQVASVTISRLHKDVSDAMYAMGLDHENEGLTDDELFSVDILARPQRVAIEVDGPFHFAANTLRSMGEACSSSSGVLTGSVLESSWLSYSCVACAWQSQTASSHLCLQQWQHERRGLNEHIVCCVRLLTERAGLQAAQRCA